MISRYFMRRGLGAGKAFRNRGNEVSRMEGFSDTVFGLAVTLLIIQQGQQNYFADLVNAIKALPAFFVCFVSLTSLWYSHYRFCRRYGLEDHWTISLNLLLLFVVLFYVYPLKYLFTLAMDQGALPANSIQKGQLPMLFAIYGIGFAAVFTILTIFYAHAYRMRKALDLNELETYDTVTTLLGNVVLVLTGLISIFIALVLKQPTLSGLWYLSILITRTALGIIRGRGRQELAARLEHAAGVEKSHNPHEAQSARTQA
jgi:uncharacterized membrane protein